MVESNDRRPISPVLDSDETEIVNVIIICRFEPVNADDFLILWNRLVFPIASVSVVHANFFVSFVGKLQSIKIAIAPDSYFFNSWGQFECLLIFMTTSSGSENLRFFAIRQGDL